MRYFIEIKRVLPANHDRGEVVEWRRTRYLNGHSISFPTLDEAASTANLVNRSVEGARVVDDEGVVRHEAV